MRNNCHDNLCYSILINMTYYMCATYYMCIVTYDLVHNLVSLVLL